MILIFTLSFLIIIACAFVFWTAWRLKTKTNIEAHLENVFYSAIGVHKVAHDNASKTVKSSMEGATRTLASFGLNGLNMDNFYNSLNKKKDQ